MSEVKCPDCRATENETIFYSIEYVRVLADLYIDVSGAAEYSGEADINWNSQQATGIVQCSDCGYEGTHRDFGISSVPFEASRACKVCNATLVHSSGNGELNYCSNCGEKV